MHSPSHCQANLEESDCQEVNLKMASPSIPSLPPLNLSPSPALAESLSENELISHHTVRDNCKYCVSNMTTVTDSHGGNRKRRGSGKMRHASPDLSSKQEKKQTGPIRTHETRP
ncbi:hypothetical protein FALCPG4_010370 [Fusarium falciforme]